MDPFTFYVAGCVFTAGFFYAWFLRHLYFVDRVFSSMFIGLAWPAFGLTLAFLIVAEKFAKTRL